MLTISTFSLRRGYKASNRHVSVGRHLGGLTEFKRPVMFLSFLLLLQRGGVLVLHFKEHLPLDRDGRDSCHLRSICPTTSKGQNVSGSKQDRRWSPESNGT